ncbi:MAG: hypothetical protein LOD92_08820, partial [Bacillales bacterium]
MGKMMAHKNHITWLSGLLLSAALIASAADQPLWKDGFLIAATVLAGTPILIKAIQAVRLRTFSIELLVSIAVIGALFIGEYVESAAWLDDGKEVLLHFFKLDRPIPGQRPKKVTLGYERLRPDTGKRTALQIIANAEGPAGWENSVYVPSITGDGSLYRIDLAKNRLMVEHSHAYG